jgi:UDP-N-acetylmuramate dehydrogenase
VGIESFTVKDYQGKLSFNEPMAKHTSLRLGGVADIYAAPETIVSLRKILARSVGQGLNVFPIGSGTNLLIRDGGIEGVVVSMSYFNRIRLFEKQDNGLVLLYVEAGVRLGKLLAFAAGHGYSGLEALAGIPGQAGGAVCMNAGAFGTEIGQLVHSIVVIEKTGKIYKLHRQELAFSYRKLTLPQETLIVSAIVALNQDTRQAVKARMKGYLEKKKSTQPLNAPSAGCVFKNPNGDFAGRLLDQSGCKGLRVGGAHVSSVHANFFINNGRASQDFLALMEIAKKRVYERSALWLEPEIRIIGRD